MEPQPNPLPQHWNGDALVTFNSDDMQIKGEMTELICGWLQDHGYTASMQLLRDEANAIGKDEFNHRKTLRLLSKAIEEGNWDGAQALIKKIDAVQKRDGDILSLLIAKQQFLELVDEGDSQRTFTFFMRRIKPLEEVFGQKTFQMFSYALSCRSVKEASGAFPELRHWSSSTSRNQLVASISARAIGAATSAYCHRQRLDICNHKLDILVAQGLSYQLVQTRKPEVIQSIPPLTVFSISSDASLQLPPSRTIQSYRVPVNIKACQPFLSKSAIAVGSSSGEILWCTIAADNKVQVERLAQLSGRVWCMVGCDYYLVASGGRSASAIDVSTRTVVCELMHHCELYCVALLPYATMFAAGTSEGEIILYDIKRQEVHRHARFSSSAVTSLCCNAIGTCVYAGHRDGCVRVVDLVDGVLLRTLTAPVQVEISCVALSPSSALLLVAYKNNTLRLWNVLNGCLLFQRFSGSMNMSKNFIRCCFGHNDRHIASASEDSSVYVWIDTSPMEVCETSPTLFQDTMPVEHAAKGTSATNVVVPFARVPLDAAFVTDLKPCGQTLVAATDTGLLGIIGPEV
jgi:hypothetical protein